MTVCEHCRSRNSWDCDDGWNRRRGGCGDFELDWRTLSTIQKETIKMILQAEEDYQSRTSNWDD